MVQVLVINISSGQYLMISGEYEDGTNDYPTFLLYRDAIDYATNKGSLVIAALGNDGLNTKNNQAMLDFLGKFRKIKVGGQVVDVPSVFDNVLAVGGIDKDKNISDFSNTAPNAIYAPAGSTLNLKKYGEIDFVDKGYYQNDWIYTTSAIGWYQYVYGNSFAAPKVSGALAEIADKYGITNPYQLKDYLFSHLPVINGIRVLDVSRLLEADKKEVNEKKQEQEKQVEKSKEINNSSEKEVSYPQDKNVQAEKIGISNEQRSREISTEQVIFQKETKNQNQRNGASVRTQGTLPSTGIENAAPFESYIGIALIVVCAGILTKGKRRKN